MATFDRFDICEAYYLFAADYNVGGYATGRRNQCPYAPNNGDILSRLSRLRFKPAPGLGLDALTENGQEIYQYLAARAETA